MTPTPFTDPLLSYCPLLNGSLSNFLFNKVLVAVSDQGSEMLEAVVSSIVDQVLTVLKTSHVISPNAINALKVLNTISTYKPAVIQTL